MYENQFIQFTSAIDPNECGMPLPIVFGGKGIAFFAPVQLDQSTTITLTDADGRSYAMAGTSGWLASGTSMYAAAMFGDYTDAQIRLHAAICRAKDCVIAIAPHECFRIKIERSGVTYWSNLFRRYENTDNLFSLVEYTCKTTTFGLPFDMTRRIRQWLPVLLNKPTPKQDDEIYEKLSGERVVMYATINKEYQAQMDYVPYSWHERMVIAMSCDYVTINDERLTKSEKYDIDWDKQMLTDCGTKMVRATWKMAANVTSRNSND